MGALLFCEQGEADRNRHSPDNYGPFEKFGSNPLLEQSNFGSLTGSFPVRHKTNLNNGGY